MSLFYSEFWKIMLLPGILSYLQEQRLEEIYRNSQECHLGFPSCLGKGGLSTLTLHPTFTRSYLSLKGGLTLRFTRYYLLPEIESG